MADDLKDVRPYINLAESFQDSNPIFSYYLRKYSIQKAHQVYTQLKSSRPDAAEGVFQQLGQWMPKAEQLSKMLVGQIDIASNMAEMLDYTERIFLSADNDYRAKHFSTQLTQVAAELRQNFMTAWRFYEVINHFSPLSEDQQKRLKYSKVKTVEVHKALKEMQKQQQQEPYRPEPPQITPGGSALQQPPQFPVAAVPSPDPPQFIPIPGPQQSGLNPYPNMSGFHIPPMQPFGFQDQKFDQPVNAPVTTPQNPNPFNFQQPSFQPPNIQQPNFQQSNFQQPPNPQFPAFQQPTTQAFQAPSKPAQQLPTTNNPPAYENSQQPATKKKVDLERVTAQNQAMTQLQNAISELSFNRVGHAKEAIRNALRLLDKYE